MYDERDYERIWLPAADATMSRAAYLAGQSAQNPHLHVDVGNYWAMRSRAMFDASRANSAKSDAAWMRAVWHYRTATKLTQSEAVTAEIARYLNNLKMGSRKWEAG